MAGRVWMKGSTVFPIVSIGLLFGLLLVVLESSQLPTLSMIVTSLAIIAFIGVGLARISTSRKLVANDLKLEEQKKANNDYQTLLNGVPVGVYRATADGKLLYANQEFAEILGYREPKELEDVNMNDVFINKSDRLEHLERLRKEPVFAEFELRRTDGRTVWVRDYPKATLNVNGGIVRVDGVVVEMHGIDAIMRDIAEHKRLQSMKDHFIVAVTHELRTPLVSIKGYVDHIITREQGLSSNLKSKIEIVKRNTDRLLELTNDLLNVQDAETGRLEFRFETMNLQEAINQCLEEIQPLLRERGQEVRLEVPGKALPVICDRLRLNEVLMNLLTNANKFAPSNGSITIRVEEDETTITVSISDNGIGIEKKDLERVFEPFAAIEKPVYFKGTGLGLSLARKLVEAQGGKIWATSLGKGQGATFAFTIPKSKEEWVEING
jgi:PAS domain S-box-containing protein